MRYLIATLLLFVVGCVPSLPPIDPVPVPPPAPFVPPGPTPTPTPTPTPRPKVDAKARANYYYAAADSVAGGFYENTGQLVIAMEQVRVMNGFPPGGALLTQTVPSLTMESKPFTDALRAEISAQLRQFGDLVRQGKA